MTTQNTDQTVLDLHDNTLQEHERLNAIVSQARQQVRSLLDQGATAKEVTYIYAYVSAEFALWHTDNSYSVFSTILRGISAATDGRSEIETKPQEQPADTMSDYLNPEVLH